MPSELMDTLRDRQAFLDLVSYLYQLPRVSCKVESEISVGGRFDAEQQTNSWFGTSR